MFVVSVFMHVEGLSSFSHITTDLTFNTTVHVLRLDMVSHQGLVRTCIITILTSPIIAGEVFLHFGVDDEVQI